MAAGSSTMSTPTPLRRVASTARRFWWALGIAGFLLVAGITDRYNRDCLKVVVAPVVRVTVPAAVVDGSRALRVCVDDACMPLNGDPNPIYLNGKPIPANAFYADANLFAGRAVTVRFTADGPHPVEATVRTTPRSRSVGGGCNHPQTVYLRYDGVADRLVVE